MSNVYFNGFVLTLGLIMAIGAQNAHVLRQGLRGEHVLLTVSVSALCDMLLITLGIAGLGSLFIANPDLMTAARYGGGAFLIWYGARSALSAVSLTVPVGGGRLLLGTWQGIFLWEHRAQRHTRRVVVTVMG